MSAIQFFGRGTVVEAFEKRNCAAWSLWAGRQFLLSKLAGDAGEAADALDEYLQMIEPSGTTATYTLKVYDEPPAGRITDKTPCDGSFNFKLRKSDETSYSRNNEIIERRLAGIEQRLTGGDDGSDKNTLGKIAEYIENNEWAQQIVSGILSHYLKIPGLPAATTSQQLAGIADSQDEQIAAAITVLKTKDAKLGEHLAKLAALPAQQLAFLLQALDSM